MAVFATYYKTSVEKQSTYPQGQRTFMMRFAPIVQAQKSPCGYFVDIQRAKEEQGFLVRGFGDLIGLFLAEIFQTGR